MFLGVCLCVRLSCSNCVVFPPFTRDRFFKIFIPAPGRSHSRNVSHEPHTVVCGTHIRVCAQLAVGWTPIPVLHQLVWGKVNTLVGKEHLRKLASCCIGLPR